MKNNNEEIEDFFPDYDGTQESAKYGNPGPNDLDGLFNNDSLSSSSEEGEVPENAYWKTKEYHRLPKNVQNAIDRAEMKKKHTRFFYKL